MAAGKHPYHWIQGAVGSNPGGLHRALGIPAGKDIPEKRLEKAENSRNPRVAREARLAETLKHMHKK